MTPSHAGVGEQMDSYTWLASEMERIAQGAGGAPAARAELVVLAKQYRELAARIAHNLRALPA